MIWVALAVVIATAIGIGAERRYAEAAGRVSRAGLTFALFFVLPPCNFLNLEGAELNLGALAGIGLAWIALGGVAGLAWLGGRRLGLPRPGIGALICAVLVVNTGYFGLPVVAAFFGFEAVSEAAAYDVLVSNLVLVTLAFGVGAAFGSKSGDSAAARVRAFFLRNPTLYAVIAALLVPSAVIPELAIEIARVVVIAILPLGFYAVGVALGEEADEGRLAFPPRFDRPVALAVGLRLAIAPVLLLAIATPLTDLPPTFPLLAAMPSGLNTMIIAHTYGLDQRIAAAAITWTTAFALLGLLVAAAFA